MRSTLLLALALGCRPDPAGSDETDPVDDTETEDTDDTDVVDPPAPLCTPPVDLVDTSTPTTVVGDGTAASCTSAALTDAIGAGGIVTFDCGGPATIVVARPIVIGPDVVVDGGGEIVISGGGIHRIFHIDSGNFETSSPTLTVQRITLRDGRSDGTVTPLGTDIDGGGSAIWSLGGSIVAIDSVFLDNVGPEEGPDVGGGAIYGVGLGSITVVGSTFQGNRSANGGAIGALFNEVTIVNSAFVGNTATGEGANYIDDSGNQAGRGGNGGALAMDGQGRALTICGSTFEGNEGGAFGGAVFRTSYESEPTTIDLSTFTDNFVPEPSDPELGSGVGGLYLQGSTVKMTRSTVGRNSASWAAGMWIGGHGDATATADLENVTIAENTAWPKEPFTETGIGGGLAIGWNTVGEVVNCTIAANEAQFASGIVAVSTLVVRNTIIANDALNEWTPLNCTGTSYATPSASGSPNLQWPVGHDDDMDCTVGITRADPLLGALGDHGGPTETMLPQDGSPAIAMGTDCPATDQRGEPRAEPCTIGAVEAD